MLDQPSPPPSDSIGCGFAGCLGGLALGLVGGGLLLFLISLVSALSAPIPVLDPSLTGPDIRIAVTEDFLNRQVGQTTDGAASIDILPGNQVRFIISTNLDLLGASSPVEIIGLLQLQAAANTVMVSLIDTQVSGVALPPGMGDLLNEDIAVINQDIAAATAELSSQLGAPITVTGVTTDDRQIQLEVRQGP